jgi:hypothetical protein
MHFSSSILIPALFTAISALAGEVPSVFPPDPQQSMERTCFQTGQPWNGAGNLRSDVAVVYGIDAGLPKRLQTWRDHGYRVHVMTGVAWGNYQEYIDGRFDGTKHEDEEQTDRNGNPHRHGSSTDVFYMCPGTNYGKFLCRGVQRALDAGVEAIHLEEPEFWVQNGYEEGFKREWQSYYHEPWQPPHSSVDAQWRASKLKYFLYRRALQQVFDYVQAFNRSSGKHVRCYVPTHSLLNYAHWRIVSPESSLARLEGCDGYIAQVWTGTSRTPNVYRGQLQERTFETAFLEYGAMQNLVRSTGRRVWYLNDPVEDNPDHDWDDYRRNWESTLIASLLQPEVWRYEVAPWPERVFSGRYPRRAARDDRHSIPPAYATELQTVMNALNDMNQPQSEWDCGTSGLGVVVSDSLMFQRGDPTPSDGHLSHVYGLALPLQKRGMPVTPVQLENVVVPRYLEGFKVLLLSYHGQKPLSAEVHGALANWVRGGGALVVVDDDSDPYNQVREWWNSDGNKFTTPRQELFARLRVTEKSFDSTRMLLAVGKGTVSWLHRNPAEFATSAEAETTLVATVKSAAVRADLKWKETNYLLLHRGPYIIAAGLTESLPGDPKQLAGRFVNLFDSDLRVTNNVSLLPGSRFFLLDLDKVSSGQGRVLASGCKTMSTGNDERGLTLIAEGVANTPAVMLVASSNAPRSVNLAGKPLQDFEYSAAEHLLWIRFPNETTPRELRVEF